MGVWNFIRGSRFSFVSHQPIEECVNILEQVAAETEYEPLFRPPTRTFNVKFYPIDDYRCWAVCHGTTTESDILLLLSRDTAIGGTVIEGRRRIHRFNKIGTAIAALVIIALVSYAMMTTEENEATASLIMAFYVGAFVIFPAIFLFEGLVGGRKVRRVIMQTFDNPDFKKKKKRGLRQQ